MPCSARRRRLSWAALAVGLVASGLAQAAPERLPAVDGLQRNGAVSRHLWAPEAATIDLAGRRVSAGLAIGLRDGVRSNLGVRAAPALNMQIGTRSTLSLLAGGNGTVMLVLQAQP